MNGTKSTLASFQQTSSSARTAHSPRLPCGFGLLNLIFFGSWTIFTRAHGRCSLPEAQASKGIALLFGAPLCGDGGRRYFTSRPNRPAKLAHLAFEFCIRFTTSWVGSVDQIWVGQIWVGHFSQALKAMVGRSSRTTFAFKRYASAPVASAAVFRSPSLFIVTKMSF